MKWQGRYGSAVSFDAELRSGANLRPEVAPELRSGCSRRWRHRRFASKDTAEPYRHKASKHTAEPYRHKASKHTAEPYAICRSGSKSLLRLKTDLRSAANFVRTDRRSAANFVRTHLARSANEDYLARSAKFANNILRKMVCSYL